MEHNYQPEDIPDGQHLRERPRTPNPPTPQSVSSTGTGELIEAASRLLKALNENPNIIGGDCFDERKAVALALLPATPPKMNAAKARVEELADMLMLESRALGVVKTSECDLRARLVEVEKERDDWREKHWNVDTQFHRLFQDSQAELDSLRSSLAAAEAALVQAKQERDGLHALHNRNAVYRQELLDTCDTLRAANTALSAQVEELKRDGELKWHAPSAAATWPEGVAVLHRWKVGKTFQYEAHTWHRPDQCGEVYNKDVEFLRLDAHAKQS